MASSAVHGNATGAVRNMPSAAAALAGVTIAGNATAITLLFAPIYTFVMPVWKEGSVGDQTVYVYVFGLFNSVAWVLYAAMSLPGSLPFIAVNGAGILLHLCYIVFYIWFATGKKQKHALLLFLAVGTVSVVTAATATLMVFTHRWSATLVAVAASASGASMQLLPAFDVVTVVKSKQANGMSPAKLLISLLNGCIWTTYGSMSVPANIYVVVPNLIGIVSAAVQIVVYLMYRRNPMIRPDAVDHGHKLPELDASPV